MAAADPLDNAVWHALNGPLARFAEGSGPVRRFQPEVAPFAGLPDDPDDEAWEALHALVGPGGGTALFRAPLAVPSRWQVTARFPCWQMLGTELVAGSAPALGGVEQLSADDRAAMLALTAATRPGPFFARTHELGRYIGVRSDGALVAMAGERMRLDGATEISAVCTDPQHRRKGLAAGLVSALAAGIRARGDLPFLHVAEDNLDAIRVYEQLGFVSRARVAAILIRAPD